MKKLRTGHVIVQQEVHSEHNKCRFVGYAYFNKEDLLINFLLYMYKVINKIDLNPSSFGLLWYKDIYRGLSDPYTSVFLSINTVIMIIIYFLTLKRAKIDDILW